MVKPDLTKINCWEFFKCGFEEGGENAKIYGTCPAAIKTDLDGLNSGSSGGRICWVLKGTRCRESHQGSLFEKQSLCQNCAFRKLVLLEEGNRFVEIHELIRLIPREDIF